MTYALEMEPENTLSLFLPVSTLLFISAPKFSEFHPPLFSFQGDRLKISVRSPFLTFAVSLGTSGQQQNFPSLGRERHRKGNIEVTAQGAAHDP